MARLVTLFLLLSVNSLLYAQRDSIKPIDTGIFSDASNHWYGIADKDAVIQPRPGHPRYPASNMLAIADNILLFQKNNGGWPKNYDMQAILTPDQVDSMQQSKNILNTTFDNRTTYSHISYLSAVYAFSH